MQDSPGPDVRYVGRTRLPHDGLELSCVDIQNCLDPFLTKRGQSPPLWPTDSNGRRPKRQSLEYVGTPSNPSIHEDWDFALYRVHDFRNAVDGGPQGFFVTATVIGDDDSIYAFL